MSKLNLNCHPTEKSDEEKTYETFPDREVIEYQNNLEIVFSKGNMNQKRLFRRFRLIDYDEMNRLRLTPKKLID
jgi:hypothetical protein